MELKNFLKYLINKYYKDYDNNDLNIKNEINKYIKENILYKEDDSFKSEFKEDYYKKIIIYKKILELLSKEFLKYKNAFL